MKNTSKNLLTAAALLAGVLTSSATVTPQGWWHNGEAGLQADSSGNNRGFGYGFSCAGGGIPGAGIVPLGVGGPLGKTGYTSTSSLYWTPLHCGAAAMWNPWGSGLAENEWNPQPTNYVIECWILPEDIASSPGRTWFFASGSGDFSQPSRPGRTGAGGVYFVWDKTAGTGGAPAIGAYVIGNASQGVPADTQIGKFVDADYTKWMHVAVVNDTGTNTFYVNGIKQGASTETNTIPNGNIFAGGSPGTTPSFHGWMDELRISTFAPGQFSVGDLLTRPAGPGIVAQPESASAWDGGVAPFTVVAAFDSSLTYQWQRNSNNIPGAISATYALPQVSAADSGAQFRCVLTAGGISLTSSVATLTVLPVKTTDVAFYRAAVTAEPSLAAYFPADGDTGTTLTNVKDATHNGTLNGTVTFDGRTTRAFGQRTVSFSAAGDVQIENNPAFEFGGGNGTVEALVYLNKSVSQDGTIFSWAWDGGDATSVGYALQASANGAQLLYVNGAPTSLSWAVPVSLLGRLIHLALVIDNTTNVTVYVDGQSLGTKAQTAFGAANGAPAFIGSIGTSTLVKPFDGTIDELAVYNSALSQNTLQVHYSRYLYGTNVSAPSIVSQPGSRTILAHSAPILPVTVAGTLPITYQWTSNNVAVPGANSPTLTVKGGAASTTAAYVLWATNAIGVAGSQPINLTFTAASGSYANAVLADSPSSYWRMGETNGPLAVDSSGYNDATYTGSFNYGVPGAITTDPDTAVKFIGSTAPVPYVSTLNPVTGFTLECYVKPTVNGQSSKAVVGSQNRNIGRSGYVLYQGFNGNFWECHIGDAVTVQMFLQGSTPIEAGKWYHLAVVYDPVNTPNGRLYVNGVLEAALSGNYLPNSSQPFTIGGRQGLGNYDGVIDELAFYNYALTGNQVSNHWSYSWVAAAITQQPVGVTNNELSTVTLTAAASGYPNTYQWYKDGVALNATKTSFDGTVHYTGGVTSPTLTIAKPTTADAGQYHMAALNALGNAQTVDVPVSLIIIDTTPPNVVSAASMGEVNTGFQTVDIQFDKILDLGGTDPITDPGTARNVANYTFVSPSGATVSTAELRKNGTAVRLTVTGLLPATTFTVKVANVRDWTRRASNAIPPAGQTVSGAVQTLMTYTTDVGSFTPPGTTYTMGPGEYEVETGGGDIWGASDAFHYGFREVSGNFDVSAQLAQVDSVGQRTGIMLREGGYGYTDAGAKFNYATFYGPANYVAFHARETAGAGPVWVNPPYNDWIRFVAPPNVWLRLQRVGDVTSAYYGTDGLNWTPMGTTTNIIQDPALLGLATCNSSLTKYAHYGITVTHPKLSISNAGGQLTISWTETGALLQSTNVTLPAGQWTVVPGTSPYVVTPAPGTPQMYYRVRQ